jgi:hypothetical protein
MNKEKERADKLEDKISGLVKVIEEIEGDVT